MTPAPTVRAKLSAMDKSASLDDKEQMKNFSAGDAKNKFGLLIDTARIEPVVIEKHGRPVAVVCSVEEYQRLQDAAGETKEDTGER